MLTVSDLLKALIEKMAVLGEIGNHYQDSYVKLVRVLLH